MAILVAILVEVERAAVALGGVGKVVVPLAAVPLVEALTVREQKAARGAVAVGNAAQTPVVLETGEVRVALGAAERVPV